MCVYSVVLLDDEELILQSLAGLIDWASLGCYIAATATDGQAGLTILDRLHPDLVITDIRMPGASGLDIARHCARYLPRCRVILLSAYADFHYAQEAIQEGALAYLLKPIDKNELTAVVGRAVDKLREDKTTAAAQEQMQTDMENARTTWQDMVPPAPRGPCLSRPKVSPAAPAWWYPFSFSMANSRLPPPWRKANVFGKPACSMPVGNRFLAAQVKS